MKKTAKILIGVLSVGALIGTGYATWHISGGFTGDEAELLPGVETVVDKNFGYIEVTAVDGDDFITFDGDANDDLTISYMVKAFANEGSDRDPYDLKNYEGIANEYIPNLKVETVVKEGDAELGEDDPFFKYVDLPSSTAIDYKTWLASEYKEKGYKVTLNFSWSKETLGGQNPEQAWKGLSVEEQETKYQELISALKDVKFTFKFIVGNDDGVVEEPETPTTTDVITLPKVEGSTLTIEGLNDGVVEAGEHALTLDITEENKALKDSTLFVTKLSKDGVKTEDKVVLEESGNRSIFKSYVGTYNFEVEYAYTFSYELEDLTTPEPDVFKTIYIKDLANLNEYGSTAYVYAWNSASNINNAEWPGEKVNSISWNIFDDNACVYKFDFNLTQYTHFVFSTKGADGNDKGQTVDIPVDDLGENDFVVLTSDTTEGKYNAEFKDYASTIAEYEAKVNLTFNEAEGKVTYDNLPHYNNDEITLTIEPNEGYEIGDVTFGDTKVTPNESGEYKVVLNSGENNINVTFNKIVTYVSINEVLTLPDKTTDVTFKGKVLALAYDGYIIADDTNYIYVREFDNLPNVGDIISVTGTKDTHTSSGSIQITNSTFSILVDETINVKDFDLKEINEEYLSVENDSLMNTMDYVYANNAICVSTGNYINLQINEEYNTKMISIKTTDDNEKMFVKDSLYNIRGFTSGFSGGKYLNVYTTEISKVEVAPESIVVENSDNLNVSVGGTINLNYTILPLGSNQDAIFEVTEETKQYATIDTNGKVTGKAPGKAEIIVKSVESENVSTSVFVNVVEDTSSQLVTIGTLSFENEFTDNSTSGSAALTLEKFNENMDVKDVVTNLIVENGYKNTDSLKFGASKKAGAIEFTLNEKYSIKAIKLEMSCWSGDLTSVNISSGDVTFNTIDLSNTLNGTFDVSLENMTNNQFKIESAKAEKCRFFITKIVFLG